MKTEGTGLNATIYGGIIPVYNQIKESGIPQIIRKHLGVRPKQATYSFEDVFISWVLTSICGGNRLRRIIDVADNLPRLEGLKMPSHDTLSRVLKKIAPPIETKDVMKGQEFNGEFHTNYFCDMDSLNAMLIEVSKCSGALVEGKQYTMHIDATFIETNQSTSKRAKDNMFGYYPLICLIDSMPVYISMRNSDSNASFDITDILEKAIVLLSEMNITVAKVISDTAGYRINLIEMLDRRGIKYNIHVPINKSYKLMFNDFDTMDWMPIELKTANHIRKCEIGTCNYFLRRSDVVNRLVICREPVTKISMKEETVDEKNAREFMEAKMRRLKKLKRLKGDSRSYIEGKWKLFKDYKIKVIITNDYDMSNESLIYEYNKRGSDCERSIAFMKGMGWKYPPFPNMNENGVFMIATSLANNIYRGMINRFKEKVPSLNPTFLRDTFLKQFINGCALFDTNENKWVWQNKKIDYHLLN